VAGVMISRFAKQKLATARRVRTNMHRVDDSFLAPSPLLRKTIKAR
jgi:hypothetical protein